MSSENLQCMRKFGNHELNCFDELMKVGLQDILNIKLTRDTWRQATLLVSFRALGIDLLLKLCLSRALEDRR